MACCSSVSLGLGYCHNLHYLASQGGILTTHTARCPSFSLRVLLMIALRLNVTCFQGSTRSNRTAGIEISFGSKNLSHPIPAYQVPHLWYLHNSFHQLHLRTNSQRRCHSAGGSHWRCNRCSHRCHHGDWRCTAWEPVRIRTLIGAATPALTWSLHC